jgi:ACS family tartrate transporter-like MFS transporter
LLSSLTRPKVIGLGLAYFGLSAGLYGVELWLPLLLKNFDLATLQIGLLAAIPYLVAIVGMLLWAGHSDRLGERRWHVILPTLLGCFGFAAVALLTHLPAALLCITVAVTGIMASRPPFWSLPTQMLAGQAAAGGIALINAIGNLGGFAGPYVIGWATQRSGSMRIGLLGIAALLVISAVLIYLITANSSPEQEQNHA